MASPQRQYNEDIQPDIRPNLRAVDGGGESTPERGNLKAVSDTSGELSNLEQSTPSLRAVDGGGESTPERGNLRSADDIKGQEEDPKTAIKHASTVTPHQGVPSNPRNIAVRLLKKGGPSAVIGLLLLVAIGTISGTTIIGSVLVNLKENFLINWDQQNITAEVRTRELMSSRLGAATAGACGKIQLACRYEKPSNRLVESLDREGIKAYKSDGALIEKQRFLAGDRPAYYETPDGKRINAGEFYDTLKRDPQVRNAFRRAYNPRWANWFDDNAMKFMGKFRLSKLIMPGFSEAKNVDEAAEAIDNYIDDLPGMPKSGSGTGERAVIEQIVKEDSEKFAKSAARSLGGKSDAALMTAAGVCLGSRVPALYMNVMRTYRMVQMGQVAMTFLSVADKIKNRNAEPQLVSNAATLLTQRHKKADGTITNSALDSGAVKYGLMNDIGSAMASKTVPKYMPGAGSGGVLGGIASVGESAAAKSVCAAVTSNEAEVAASAVKLFKLSNPAGWMLLLADVIVWGLDEAGVLEQILTPLIQAAITGVSAAIDWEAVLEVIAGDVTKNAEDEELGDVLGILATMLGIKANMSGDAAMTPEQYQTFQAQVANPVRLAWAEEDRLNHSPLDATNPNTVLGSITAKLMYYYSDTASASGVFGSLLNIVGSTTTNLLSPNSYAATPLYSGLCTVEKDYAVATSGVAAGPLCDEKYAIPTEYLGINPSQVLIELFEAKQIDEAGEIVADSTLSYWTEDCHSGNVYSLPNCMINSREKALYALYRKDKGQADSMDNPPQSIVEVTSGVAGPPAPGSRTGQVVDGFAWIVDKKWYDDPASHYGLMKGHQANSGWYFKYPDGQRYAMDMSPSSFIGSPVYALTGGVVKTYPGDRNATFYIESDINGKVLKSLFAHGQNISVKDGDTVTAGQQVMQVGNTGNSAVPHIHWELQYDSKPICGNDILNNLAQSKPIILEQLTGQATANCLGRA